MTKIAASQRLEVANLCIAGKPMLEVAADYGVTRACITAILRNLGIKLASLPRGPRVGTKSGMRLAIAEMYRSGKTQLEVGASFGISGGRVCQILRGIGVTAKDRPKRGVGAPGNYKRVVQVSSHQTMIDMYRSGSTLENIGGAYGISRERVRQIIASTGLTRIDGGSSIRCFLNSSKKISAAKAANEKTEARISSTWAMSLDNYKAHVAEYGSTSNPASPMSKYKQQRSNAKRRGIAWDFTFPEWWGVWQESGKWSERALRKDGYVMARWGDGVVPYSVGTVHICTQSENSKESFIVSPHAVRFANSPSNLGSGLGYTILKKCTRNPFLVQIAGKSLGTYPTAELAREVYLNAAKGISPPARSHLSKGESHMKAKLTTRDVLAIRADPRSGSEVAIAFGINRSTVSQIRNFKAWKHVAAPTGAAA